MRVLFVDDEAHVLEDLERLLRHQQQWDLRFANSGVAALQALEREPVDVVATDARMPGMDGAALLEQVKERFPDAVRMVLCGPMDADAVARTTAVAHQYVAKPCEADSLAAALARAASLRELLQDEAVRRLVGRLDTLPSAPSTWSELQRLMGLPDATTRDVAAVVRRDAALSTKLLQLVNSAFLGLTREVTDIDEAVTYLGFRVLQRLVLTVEVFRSLVPARQIEGFSVTALMRHGEAVAALTTSLVSPNRHAPDLGTAALLHDVGQLALAACQPDQFAATLAAARHDEVPLHLAEEQLHGFTHADVGAYLLALWGLPTSIWSIVRAHHEPLVATPQNESHRVVPRVARLLVQSHDPSAMDPTETTDPVALSRELARLADRDFVSRSAQQAQALLRDRATGREGR